MEQITDNGKGKRGRPALGNKLFARRLPASKIAEIEALLKADRVAGPGDLMDAPWVQTSASPTNLKALEPTAAKMLDQAPMIKALLEDVERLEAEKIKLNENLRRCSEASDDQKLLWWKAKYEAVVKKYNANEHDQT